MGKKRRRLTSPKFANYRARIQAKRGVVEIDMNTGEEIAEEETVQVVKNKKPEPKESKKASVPTPEPQLQTIPVEEPKTNALKETKKTTATRRKRATKKTTSAD